MKLAICTNVLDCVNQIRPIPESRSAPDPYPPLRGGVALRKQALEEKTLKTFHRDRAPLRLRYEDRPLEGTDDETGEILNVGVSRQLARIDRRLKAVGDRSLVFREHRGNAKANRVARLTRFGAEVSVQTSSAHVVLAQVFELSIDPRSQATKRRQPVVSKRRPDIRARHLPVSLEDLESKCFFRSAVVRERALRNSCRLGDVAHAGRTEPTLVHQAESVGEQFFLVRGPRHTTSMPTPVTLVKTWSAPVPDQVSR